MNQVLDSSSVAFWAGMVTSLHCVGMCGPLSCAWGMNGKRGGLWKASAFYHSGRLLAYAAAGAVAGALGSLPSDWLQTRPVALLPWALVLAFLMLALGWEQRLPKILGFGKALRCWQTWAMRQGPSKRALLLGLATPLLPCAPLYLMLGVAMSTGRASNGAGFAAAFALGTMPLLIVAQCQLQHLSLRLGPAQLRQTQQGLALMSALILLWRLRGTFAGEASATCCGWGS